MKMANVEGAMKYRPVSADYFYTKGFAREVEHTFIRGTRDLLEIQERLRELKADFEAHGDPGMEIQGINEVYGAISLIVRRFGDMTDQWSNYASNRD